MLFCKTKTLKNISDEERTEILLDAVRSNGNELLNWNENVNEFLARISCLQKWFPNENFPFFMREHLLATPEEWLAPYLISVKRKSDFAGPTHD